MAHMPCAPPPPPAPAPPNALMPAPPPPPHGTCTIPTCNGLHRARKRPEAYVPPYISAHPYSGRPAAAHVSSPSWGTRAVRSRAHECPRAHLCALSIGSLFRCSKPSVGALGLARGCGQSSAGSTAVHLGCAAAQPKQQSLAPDPQLYNCCCGLLAEIRMEVRALHPRTAHHRTPGGLTCAGHHHLLGTPPRCPLDARPE